ncbi:replication initiation protein [Streptomyces pluripotens]|uniref:Replication initiation protein n=1 Tax=Streptomyces pluripotens TaxID=1355015 RepID=A0A221NY68_9ACTN|nr:MULTISPECIES: replication initiator [Streptomyces]ARP70195.1 replication initiation protein [Streptomyces pluripotens]ASN24455.1 replication initiation protein [Streptomyces pluripotens]MCH0561458.1 replication initiation protein [Streptomyces sp. MUM 16J]
MPPHDPTTTIPRPELATAALPTFTGYRDLLGLVRQLSSLGGCSQPVRLEGQRIDVDAFTGEILRELKSKELPAGHLLVRCGNRRATRCPSCAELYRQDTYQLIAAGLRGGKNIPDQVATHPRVFATLTAPSYGPVHGRRVGGSARCRCGRTHAKGDPLLGTALDPERYDYTGAVLWNAHAPALWARFMLHLRRTIAAVAGVPQRLLSKVVRVSYAKVAEYQQRGLIHFHAVIRLDGPAGPAGPYTPPPAWATPDLLADAIRISATRARIDGPEVNGRARAFVFGEQIDTRVIRSMAFQGGTTITEGKVAGYVAKYATKGTEAATGTLDHRLKRITDLWFESVPEHAARMIRTAWALGARDDLKHLNLRKWAHMLGFRGHFSTKTRAYSTTLGALRAARAAWQRRHTPPPSPTTLVLAHWAYDGAGLTPDLERLAALIGGGPTREQEVTTSA